MPLLFLWRHRRRAGDLIINCVVGLVHYLLENTSSLSDLISPHICRPNQSRLVVRLLCASHGPADNALAGLFGRDRHGEKEPDGISSECLHSARFRTPSMTRTLRELTVDPPSSPKYSLARLITRTHSP